MLFKDELRPHIEFSLAHQFEIISPRLRALLLEMDYYSKTKFGIEIIITSLLREEGIHKCARAGDVRSRDYTEKQAQELKDHMNEFIYDETRPKYKTCLYGDENHLDHFHLQAKP